MGILMEQRTVAGLARPVAAIGAGCWTIGGAATNRGIPIGWDGSDDHGVVGRCGCPEPARARAADQ